MRTFKAMVVILSCLAVMYACQPKTKSKDEATTEGSYAAKTDASLCDASWFPHVQTPAPKEGNDSPFDTSSTTNDIFHQWSWQKFLWLTKPTYEISLFPILIQGEPEPIVIVRKEPLFLNPKKVKQIDSNMDTVQQQEGAAVVLKATHQAGSASAVLKTNPAYSDTDESATVFYSIHMDPIMYDAAQLFKEQLLDGQLDSNNLSSFPVGSFELKVSWVAKSAIAADKLDQYYTTVAAISTDGGATFVNTEVAMLGMHVVGVVENHPEFIWATFEHDDLAPDYDWAANEATSSEDLLLFAKGTTTGLDGILYDKTTQAAVEPYKNYDLFKYGVPVDNTGAFMETSQNEPENFKNIDSINLCVKASLADVWQNYFYNGSIWINTDGLTPEQQADTLVAAGYNLSSATPGSIARGSLNCANVTMETYTQTFKKEMSAIQVGNLANCFSCHNAVSFTNATSPIYISHVFDAFILQKKQGLSDEEVETVKAKQEVIEFMKMSQK